MNSLAPHRISVAHITLLAALVRAQGHVRGAVLAQALGLTRARISQLVGELNTCGADIAATRAGYRAAFPNAMLDAEICAAGTAFAIEIVPTIESTNAALERAGAVHRSVLLAEWQAQGRGRRGRAWQGAPGGSILLSVAWQFAGGAASLSGLSLLVGLAVAQALDTCGADSVQLKWPNDIVWRGQKLGGVLIGLSGDALGPTTAVIGIGLNVHLPEEARSEIDQAVTDLSQIAQQVAWNRNTVVNALLKALEMQLDAFASHGFAPVASQWRALHAFEGKPTRALLPDQSLIDADATTVDDTGALVLKRGAMTHTLHSAEISLRKAS